MYAGCSHFGKRWLPVEPPWVRAPRSDPKDGQVFSVASATSVISKVYGKTRRSLVPGQSVLKFSPCLRVSVVNYLAR